MIGHDRDQGRSERHGVLFAVLDRVEAGHALDDADLSAHMDGGSDGEFVACDLLKGQA